MRYRRTPDKVYKFILSIKLLIAIKTIREINATAQKGSFIFTFISSWIFF